MLILGDVGLQIRLSDCSTFRSTSGRLQSKNVPLDLPARLDLQSDRNEYKHF